MKNYLLAIICLALLALSACGNKSTSTANSEAADTASTNADSSGVSSSGILTVKGGNAPLEFQKQIDKVCSKYIAVKQALTTSSTSDTKTAGVHLVDEIALVDSKLLPENERSGWIDYHEALLTHAMKLSKAKDIDKQRQHFASLSVALYDILKKYGSAGVSLYWQFCPMAFDNKGAAWLDNTAEITNPYFGDKMLHCGKNKECLVFQK